VERNFNSHYSITCNPKVYLNKFHAKYTQALALDIDSEEDQNKYTKGSNLDVMGIPLTHKSFDMKNDLRLWHAGQGHNDVFAKYLILGRHFNLELLRADPNTLLQLLKNSQENTIIVYDFGVLNKTTDKPLSLIGHINNLVFVPVREIYNTVGDEIYVHAVKNFRVPDYEDDKFNFFKKENYITSKHAKPVNVIIISEPMRLTDKLPNIQSICLNNYL
jgi:hypothetical protein